MIGRPLRLSLELGAGRDATKRRSGRIVTGDVRPDRTSPIESVATRERESRAKNADVMHPRRRFAVGLPGLLARSRASPHEFADFYEQMSPQVLRFFVRRTDDPHRAVDLTAETFARAFEHRREFRGASDEQAAAWLWRIARNELAGYRRSRAVELAAVQRLGLERALTDEELVQIERLSDAEALREQIQHALEVLPDEQQEVIRLRFIDELSYDEMAEKLGVSNDVVRTRTSRALRALRASAHLHEAIQRLKA
ncbi:MAG: polymerase sigma factor [Solirubrobacterales bacterium]|nr:polymerase sigma factor [Solirubrobacterales bacterium]